MVILTYQQTTGDLQVSLYVCFCTSSCQIGNVPYKLVRRSSTSLPLVSGCVYGHTKIPTVWTNKSWGMTSRLTRTDHLPRLPVTYTTDNLPHGQTDLRCFMCFRQTMVPCLIFTDHRHGDRGPMPILGACNLAKWSEILYIK